MELRAVPRLVWTLAVARFFSAASSFLMLFLTLYLTGSRQLSTPVAGLVSGAFGVGMLLGNLTGGRWGDRHGHRPVLVWASTLSGLTIAAVPWQPAALLPLTLPLAAYAGATAGVSAGALSVLAVARGERRTSVAIGRAFSNAGFVVGPPLGAVLAAHSYDALFVVDGLMTLVVRFATLPALAVTTSTDARPDNTEDNTAAGRTEPRAGLWRALRADRALLAFLPAVVLADVVYRQLYATVPLRLRDAGEPVGLYTTLVALGSGLILLLEIPVAQRLQRRAAYPIVASGYALVGLGMLAFGLPVTVASAVVAMVVVTAGEILYKTTATAHVIDAAPDHLVGQYQGLYTAAATSGTMLAAPLGTAVYAAQPPLLWPLCLAVCLVAGALVLRVGRGVLRPGTAAARRRRPPAARSAPSARRP